MGLINNEELYPKDKKITINDQVIGSDKDNNGVTRNYPMSGIVSVINDANELKFSLYKYSDDDANLRKGVFNITGSDFKFSDTDQESNNNTALFNVIKNNKENIILYLKDGTENFGYYHVKNATQNTQSFTFELELIHNIKAGSYVLENTYVFNIGITTSTLTQIQSDWNESNAVEPSFIKNKPLIPTKYTDEEVRDVVGATLVAGSNVTITPDDAADTITIDATSSGTTDLSYVPSTRTIESSSGKNTVIPTVTSANAGLMKANFYEEGTFNPVLNAVGVTDYKVTQATGGYTRVGNLVHYYITIYTSGNTIGTPTSELKISGLPFNSLSTQSLEGGVVRFFVGSNLSLTDVSNLTIGIGFNSTDLYFHLKHITPTSPSPITFSGGGIIRVSGTYTTNFYTP
ncbi:hypothetical protein M1M25_gp082 [Tenacibaculum phage Gundel_1]|uniref:Uncharacterized protein n=1 Tax=Tenacibaculum phage Gundel_1 TaxID=2745672 RepID=A0A8E4ZM94_9CAUD|nr:hypothetical protein M1M25_gp082 [Tenacibaculum phage Gundel_1]QQV91519.1 hypothetical protein Gundel1_82 [Tenacibaculum phage Gundel_1]